MTPEFENLEGEKYTLPGGATRSEKAPAYHLVPLDGPRRTAIRFGLGAEKHGPWNWWRSVTLDRATAYKFAAEAYNHMLEHAQKMACGDFPDDDHLGAIGWAQCTLCAVEEYWGEKWTDLRFSIEELVVRGTRETRSR